MGFFSGIRRRIKKIIPKEIRPAIPFIAAAFPGAGMGLGALGAKSAMGSFLRAAATKGLTDDEADVKDILRTGAIAAAPQAISGGLGSVAQKYGPTQAVDFADKLTMTEKIGSGAQRAKDYIEGLGTLKTVGAQSAVDFGIKQAELNEKAIEEYNRNLLEKGIRDKGARRSAIFSIFTRAGYDEDETNTMLDKYGYADGGRVPYRYGKSVKKNRGNKIVNMEDVISTSVKGNEEDNDETMTTLEEIAENARDKKDLEDKGFDASEFSENLQSGISGLEKAFGQPLGGRRPEPMRIIPGFASGGDVDEVMETEEEIITPDYLMKEEGVEIGEQVSAPSGMDELNQLSLDMFGRPVFELSEEEFEMLKDFASQQALKPGLIDEYRNYKYQMEEQGMTPMSPRDYFRNEFGAARLGVAKGGPIEININASEDNTKMASGYKLNDFALAEEPLRMGFKLYYLKDDPEAGTFDADTVREMIYGGQYKKGGKVIKIMPEGVLYKGKAKDYPGIKQLIKDMKKKGTRNKKADGGVTYSFEDYLKEREMLDKKGNMERLRKEYKEDMRRKKVKEEKTMAKDGGLMSMGGNELDLRGGGFVPMGKKERADDVPARLSKNEFVFTADAVRAAGGGSVQKGADLMYDTMKKLEAQS